MAGPVAGGPEAAAIVLVGGTSVGRMASTAAADTRASRDHIARLPWAVWGRIGNVNCRPARHHDLSYQLSNAPGTERFDRNPRPASLPAGTAGSAGDCCFAVAADRTAAAEAYTALASVAAAARTGRASRWGPVSGCRTRAASALRRRPAAL